MERNSVRAELAVVLGSGLDALLQFVDIVSNVPYGEVQELAPPTAPGHRGMLVLARLAGHHIYLFCGRSHCYEGLAPAEAGRPARVAAGLGCSRLLLTQAAGSLRRDMPVGTWMLAGDIISFPWSSTRPAGPVAGEPAPKGFFSSSFMGDIRAAASARGIRLSDGTLFWTVGPAYETRAEAHAAVELGAHAASMSALPELETARTIGMESALLSYITNYAATVPDGGIDHGRVVKTAARGAPALASLLEGLLS
jgi:purine-nucleoside phosphorylase